MFIQLLSHKRICFFSAFIVLLGSQIVRAASPPPRYLGYKRCRGCHKKEYNSWKDSAMAAAAFAALVPGLNVSNKTDAGLDPMEDFTQNPKCLSCHATGYGDPGGFKNFSETPDLTGVTCEACHGPGEKFYIVMSKKRKSYRIDELFAAGFIRPNQETCNKCHKPGCPTTDENYEIDFDDSAGHNRFPLQYDH